MTLERVTDHMEQGAALLLTQFQRKPRLGAWLKSYLRQVQLLEDAIYDVIIKRLIDNAVGAQLDTLGRVVDEPRRGRADDVYRVFIRVRVRINRSAGRTKDVLDVLGLITTTSLLFDEYFPAAMAIEFIDFTEYDPVLMLGMLRDAKMGGVGLDMVVPTAPVETRFLWMSVGDTSSPDNGYGDANDEEAFGLLSDAVSMR